VIVIGAGFSSAVQYLHNDGDFRHKYFDEGNVEFRAEMYSPSDKPSDGSDALRDAIRDGAIDPKEGGYVIPVSDPNCDWWDAARHIPRFKRNAITVPRSDEEFDAWYWAGHKEYQRKLKRLNERERSAQESGGRNVFRADAAKFTWKGREVRGPKKE